MTTRAALLMLPLLVTACAPAAPTASSGPPSLSVVPANYYWYHYSRRLHRQVRDVVPARELWQEPDAALDAAARQVHRLRYQMAAPPK